MLAQECDARRPLRRISIGEPTTEKRALAGEGRESRRYESGPQYGDSAAWLQQAPVAEVERLERGE